MNRPLDLPLISVDLSREADFSIGALKVCPSHRQVNASDQQETVQPRVMQVLVALARAKGAVLSRDNLVETCWDGLNVGDDAINRCIAKVRQIAEFADGRHFEIETIPRVGYRLAPTPPGARSSAGESAAIQASGACGSVPKANDNGTPGFLVSVRHRITRSIVYAIAAVLIVAAAGVLLVWLPWPPRHQASSPHRDPLLAVLPLRNLSEDAGSRYLSDGVTQEIIDALLQLTEIRVAAPASSFALRNAGVPRFAKTLAATHVLSGSIERHGAVLRVVAQLADMGRNRVIWSRIYRTTVAETPALQHHIAVQIANALDMRLSSQSLKDAAHVEPLAYDHFLRGRDLFRQRRDISVAAKELEDSVRLAPGFAKAWSSLAAVRYLMAAWSTELRKDPAPMREKARGAAIRALALDSNNGEAFGVLAMTSEGNRLTADGLFERALQAEPNNTQLLNWHHIFLLSVGRYREANDEIERAYDLDRLTPAIVYNAAINSVEHGDFERARQIIELGIDYCSPEEGFELRAQYLLSIRDWNGLARHLGTLPTTVRPPIAASYRLAAQTSVAIANNQSDKFAALRTRWRAETSGDRFYTVTFLTLLGDTKGALKVIEAALASGASTEAQLLFVPALPALRRDSGGKALMAQEGLFEYWRASDRWPDFCEETGLPFNCRIEAQKVTP